MSFRDALIVAAAVDGRADPILTEDLQAGEVIEGIRIVKPFLYWSRGRISAVGMIEGLSVGGVIE